MSNTTPPFVVLADGGADDDVHLSIQVGAGHMSVPFYQEL
jgi:hypothetical protein